MEIKILGTGCPRCKEVEKRTMNALAEMNAAADVQKISNIKDIASFGIISTPGLVINGKVKCSDRIPSIEEVKSWVKEEI